MRLGGWLLGGAVGVLALAAAAPLQAEDIEYVYDVHGRLILVRHVGSAQTAYVYDPADNRSQMVTALPGAPVPGVDFVNTAKNTAVTFDPRTNDADGDGNSLTVTGKTNGTNGTVSYTSSSLTYTPTTNFVGDDTFTYTLSDGTNTATGTVKVKVASSNSPPNAGPDRITVAKNSAGYTFNPRTNDSDPNSDTLTITAKTNGGHGTVSIESSGTQLKYIPATNYAGNDSFTYTISDGNSGTATTTVVVKVNAGPSAVNDSQTTTRNVAKTFDPRTNDTDENGDTLTITTVSTPTAPAHGAVVINGGVSVTYTPTAGYSGSDSFSYTISDGTTTSTATVSVTISANVAPVTVSDTRTVSKNAASTFDPRTNDSDPNGDSLTITAKTNGSNGTVAYTGTSVTYTPTTNYTGSDSFTYTVSDGQGGSTVGTVNVTVVNNTFPVAADDYYLDNSYTNNEASTIWGDIPISVLNNDSDADSHTLTIQSFSQGANGGVVTQSGNTLIYHAGGPTGTVIDSFTYTVSDGNGGTATATVYIELYENITG
ncbi:MAG TPA: Ig-like domain-containing protein [Caulobacter sp.]|nr:Ig-like domain-containing protein [Caulobacter sp.]